MRTKKLDAYYIPANTVNNNKFSLDLCQCWKRVFAATSFVFMTSCETCIFYLQYHPSNSISRCVIEVQGLEFIRVPRNREGGSVIDLKSRYRWVGESENGCVWEWVYSLICMCQASGAIWTAKKTWWSPRSQLFTVWSATLPSYSVTRMPVHFPIRALD